MWLELKQWHTHELTTGGLMEQPSWTWLLMSLAGATYERKINEADARMRELQQ